MKIKTYGINNLSEWHGEVKTGSISVKVSFTGGTASPSGAQPAYMVTKDPITQFVIENSKEFKDGFIHLEMSQDMPGEHHRMAVPKKIPTTNNEPQPVTIPLSTQAPKPTETEKKTIEATDWDDAREYLANNFGVARRYMRSHAAVLQYASENNVNFVGLGDEGE